MADKEEIYDSVWDALSDTPGESASMKAKSELMMEIADFLKKKKWTQTEAAKRCGITQPRMSDMMRGRISQFSLDALVNIAASLGQQVHIELRAA